MSSKEDIKHVLEELWDSEEEEPLYKIFARECLGAKHIQKVLQHSKKELKDIPRRDDDDAILCLRKHEVGDVLMMVHYKYHFRANDLLLEEKDKSRFNSIIRKDCISFVGHPVAMALVRSTGNMTATPLANTALTYNFKVACAPDESFKSPLKEIQVFLLLLSKVNIGIIGTGTPSSLLERRT